MRIEGFGNPGMRIFVFRSIGGSEDLEIWVLVHLRSGKLVILSPNFKDFFELFLLMHKIIK